MAERTDPTHEGNHPFYCQYRAVYEYAKKFVTKQRVMDAGCGEGYGAELLAKNASQVVAIDSDRKTIQRARQRYRQSNLQFYIGDIGQLSAGFPHSFDVVCCFHTIEHLKEPTQFLQRIGKLLSNSGVLLISTPNREKTFIEWPYHEREYTVEGFRSLLSTCFADVTLYALHADRSMHQFRNIQAQTVRSIIKWDILQLHRRLPKGLRQIIFDIAGMALNKWLSKTHRDCMSHITLQDFSVKHEQLNEGLDLIGMCREPWNIYR